MSIALVCPACGRIAMIDEHAFQLIDDKIDPVLFQSPSGFKKLILGPTSEDVHLSCIDCEVSAELPIFH